MTLQIIILIVFIFALIKLYIELRNNLSNPENLKEKKEDKLVDKKLWIEIGVLLLASRLAIYLIAYCNSRIALASKGHYPNFFLSFKSIWTRWDVTHFLNIAQNGYWGLGRTQDQSLLVHFPFFPLLIKLLHDIFSIDYFAAGMFISLGSLVFSCFYLFKLANLDLDKNTSFRSIQYLLIFPFSFYLGIPYSESLFLALSIGCLYYARQRKWLWVGLLGFFASITRGFGSLLIIPALIEFFIAKEFFVKTNTLSIKEKFKDLLLLSGIPLGAFCYFVLNLTVAGDWLRFMECHKMRSGTKPAFFAETLSSVVNTLGKRGSDEDICIWIPQTILISLSIFLLFYAFKRLRVSYIAYMLAYMLTVFSQSWLISGCRYLLALFPIYLLLGLVSRNKIIDLILSIFSICCLAFYTTWFVRGFPIM